MSVCMFQTIFRATGIVTTFNLAIFVTGPLKTGDICTNYTCSENGTFLGLCLRYSCSVTFIYFRIDL